MKKLNLVVLTLLFILAIVTSTYLANYSGSKPRNKSSLNQGGEVRRRISMEAEDGVIHYKEKTSWNKDDFSNITNNKSEFKSVQIAEFNELYNVDADNFDIKFNEEENSTTLKCNVYKKISTSGNRRRATFLWFLNPQGLDFIDDNFEESKDSLSWEGKINNIQTSITIRLPKQGSVYGDWDEPVGHCHGHIWWPKSKT